MKAVIDTSAWYAWFNDADPHYEEVKSVLSNLPLELFILSTVFNELIALLFNRKGKTVAVKAGEVLLGLGLRDLEKQEESDAWKLFKQSKADISYVDCTIVVLARKLVLPIFTFDKHFKDLGLETVPISNPMIKEDLL